MNCLTAGLCCIHWGWDRTSRKPWAEIDLSVLACAAGVFCLEVKGGRVQRSNGVWIYVDGSEERHPNAEGPFAQAGSASAALFKHLRFYHPRLNYWSATESSPRILSFQYAAPTSFPTSSMTSATRKPALPHTCHVWQITGMIGCCTVAWSPLLSRRAKSVRASRGVCAVHFDSGALPTVSAWLCRRTTT